LYNCHLPTLVTPHLPTFIAPIFLLLSPTTFLFLSPQHLPSLVTSHIPTLVTPTFLLLSPTTFLFLSPQHLPSLVTSHLPTLVTPSHDGVIRRHFITQSQVDQKHFVRLLNSAYFQRLFANQAPQYIQNLSQYLSRLKDEFLGGLSSLKINLF
jgi:hypothetical protein